MDALVTEHSLHVLSASLGFERPVRFCMSLQTLSFRVFLHELTCLVTTNAGLSGARLARIACP